MSLGPPFLRGVDSAAVSERRLSELEARVETLGGILRRLLVAIALVQAEIARPDEQTRDEWAATHEETDAILEDARQDIDAFWPGAHDEPPLPT